IEDAEPIEDAESTEEAVDEHPAAADVDMDSQELEFITPSEPHSPTPRQLTPQESNGALAGLPMMNLESSPAPRVSDPINDDSFTIDFGADDLLKDDDAIDAATPVLSRHSMRSE